MNKDQTEGNWKQFKGKVKEKWGKLTDDAFLYIKRDDVNPALISKHPLRRIEIMFNILSMGLLCLTTPFDKH